MLYRIILLTNGKYKKTLHRCNTKTTAYLNYFKLISDNKVLYPKHFLNSNGIKPVSYKICISKITEKDDTFRILRDNYGRVYTEDPLGDWTILASEKYHIEDTFWIYGLEDRVTIHEVIKKLMIGAYGKKMVKQIIVVHNKLIIYNEDQFDMVICKNKIDARRLHHTLAKIATKQKIKSLLFMGTAAPAMVGRMYDLILEHTNWSIEKIRRTSTRP